MTETRSEIRFLLNGAEVRLGDVRSDETLLDFLCIRHRLTGAKEGCAEGSGRLRVGGQDHFYFERQIAMAMPSEDDDITVISLTQHPSEVQHMVAHVLGLASNNVTVEVRRMGGAFGGKETQAIAVIAALGARKLGRAVKIRPDRDDDMVATGKRHDFLVDYAVGFDDDGRIEAADVTLAARCGFSAARDARAAAGQYAC